MPSVSAQAETGWRLGGEPFDPDAVLAVGTAGERSWRLTIARSPLDCDALRKRYPDHPTTAESVDLWFAHPIGVDGTLEAWSYRSGTLITERGGRSLVARGAMLDDVAETPEIVTIRRLELALEERGEPRRLLQFAGDLRARNCGRVPRPEPARPQSAFHLSIAGQTVAVQGASVRTDGERRILRLTRAPHRCDSAFTEGFDFFADLAIEGSPPRFVHLALLGDSFPETATGSRGKETLSLKTSNLDATKGDVRIDLDGTIDAGGYVVRLDGRLDAQRCVSARR